MGTHPIVESDFDCLTEIISGLMNTNNLYHSPESLRSPFRRINSIDTPKQNRYKKRSLLEATKQMSNSPDSYEVTSSLDDTREGDISALEKELLEAEEEN